MKTEVKPTIAWLWKEAEYLIELTIPHFEGLANPNNRVNEERRPIYVAGLAKCKDKLESLRQQLVERCSVPCYNFSASPLEEIEYHKEMSAIHGFWAWELQQREKEAKNGN